MIGMIDEDASKYLGINLDVKADGSFNSQTYGTANALQSKHYT